MSKYPSRAGVADYKKIAMHIRFLGYRVFLNQYLGVRRLMHRIDVFAEKANFIISVVYLFQVTFKWAVFCKKISSKTNIYFKEFEKLFSIV